MNQFTVLGKHFQRIVHNRKLSASLISPFMVSILYQRHPSIHYLHIRTPTGPHPLEHRPKLLERLDVSSCDRFGSELTVGDGLKSFMQNLCTGGAYSTTIYLLDCLSGVIHNLRPDFFRVY